MFQKHLSFHNTFVSLPVLDVGLLITLAVAVPKAAVRMQEWT
jgi:flagellar biosynthesis protein FliQ